MGILRDTCPPDTRRPIWKAKSNMSMLGDQIINEGNARTVREFFSENPFHLSPNQTYHIYEVDESGSKKFFAEGTPSQSPTGTPSLADTPLSMSPPESSGPSRYREQADFLRDQNTFLKAQAMEKDQTINSLVDTMNRAMETMNGHVEARIEAEKRAAELTTRHTVEVEMLRREMTMKEENNAKFAKLEEKQRGLADANQIPPWLQEAFTHLGPVVQAMLLKWVAGDAPGADLQQQVAKLPADQQATFQAYAAQMAAQRAGGQSGIAGYPRPVVPGQDRKNGAAGANGAPAGAPVHEL
jgi:hypothetical protein